MLRRISLQSFTRGTVVRALSSSSLTSSARSSSPSTTGPPRPTHYKVTLLRSAIGLPSVSTETLEALGLKRLHQTVFHPFSATTAGQILRVKELVKVENVAREEVRTQEEIRAARRPRSGFSVVGREQSTWAVNEEETSVRSIPAPSSPPLTRSYHTSSRFLFPSTTPAPVLSAPLTPETSLLASSYLTTTFKSFLIPRSACQISYTASGGPGGQNVNKVATKVVLRFPLSDPLPTWFPKWSVDGLRKSAYYLASQHALQLTSTLTRSQASNLEDALAKLHKVIYEEAEKGLVKEASEEQKRRIEGFEKKEADRRRMEKSRRKSIKAGRRGEW